MFEGVKRILMERYEMTAEDADELIDEAEEQFDDYVSIGDLDSAYLINAEYFGLEPDYLL